MKQKNPRHSFLYLGRINKSAVPPIIDVKSTLSYTNIYAAKITDAVSVAPYLQILVSGTPSKVHSASCFILRFHLCAALCHVAIQPTSLSQRFVFLVVIILILLQAFVNRKMKKFTKFTKEMGEVAKWNDMAEGKSKNRKKQKKSISFATGCVFCSVRAPVIHHSRKPALRLRHFARWRKLARTSLRKPRHYRLTDRFFYVSFQYFKKRLVNQRLLQLLELQRERFHSRALR